MERSPDDRNDGAKFVREEAAVIRRPSPRRRFPCIAATFGFLVPGLGHVYSGRPQQGAFWYAVTLLFPLVLALTGWQLTFKGFLLILALELAVTVVVMVHGAYVAHGRGAVILASWQRWWIYGTIVVLAFAIGIIMQNTVESNAMGIRVFKIPSQSMEPGLLIGDHIAVNLRAYGSEVPERGDVVVFRHPEHPDIFFIKRVVAVGGDTVAVRGLKLYVNGKAVDEPYLFSGSAGPRPDMKTFGPLTVERGKLFVLGDNRDDSYDSRQWGSLDMDFVVGKALYIYWSWDRMHKAPRMGRIGMDIR